MIECVFTLDYEIYGDGTGSLKDLVYEPAEELREMFWRWNARFVAFIEVAELERIDACGTDPAIDRVKRQIRDLYRDDFEIGLHLHPQWCNAHRERGRWVLDYGEYNLCTLPVQRICQIVGGALDYLRSLLQRPQFRPLSFRAGNWLFQPTAGAASALVQHGIRLDSSVFKGGLQHTYALDYRRALQNGYYWPFGEDVNVPDPCGALMEVPIHTEMAPIWRVPTSKRVSLGNSFQASGWSVRRKVRRSLDFLRFRYPLKLDFCRMTLDELAAMVNRVLQEDRVEPAVYRPIVVIGHTKDLTDLRTVDAFLSFLHARRIPVSTFRAIWSKLREENESYATTSGDVHGMNCTSPTLKASL